MHGNRTRRRCNKNQRIAYRYRIDAAGIITGSSFKKAIERIVKIKGEKVKDIQVAFLALNKKGQAGAFAIHKGFSYAIKSNDVEKLIDSKSYFS